MNHGKAIILYRNVRDDESEMFDYFCLRTLLHV